jgi:RNA recognition motif-containing protein
MNIYVGSLHYDLSEDELKEIFEEYGEVSSVRIITDKFTGRSKGFGFVEMTDNDSANQAIEELNDSEVKGRSIRVNESIERKDQDRRKGGSGGGGGGYGGGNRGGGDGGNGGGDNYRSRY